MLAMTLKIEKIVLRKKETSDVSSTMNRIKNNSNLSTERERMNYFRKKSGSTLRRAKDERKGMWLTTRALENIKKCVN